MRRKRFSQPWLRSTTEEMALKPASLLMACASSLYCDVGGEAELLQGAAHFKAKSEPLSRHNPGDALGWAPPSMTPSPAAEAYP